jgi:hypothetical protein
MKPPIQNLARAISIAGVFFFSALLGLGSASTKARKFDLKNFEILGITLGRSTREDVDRILGPAKDSPALNPEEAVRCYASPESDRTILQLQNWMGDVIGFRLFRGTTEEVSRCALTSRISDSISTNSGLRLGISRRQVINLLGSPTKRGANLLSYQSAFLRALTTEERKLAQKSYHVPPEAVEVCEKIEFRFKGSKVVAVEAVRNETW